VVLATNQVAQAAGDPRTPSQARCASAFLPPKQALFLANDGSAAGINGSQQLMRILPRRYVVDSQSVDPAPDRARGPAREGKGAKMLVYTGDASAATCCARSERRQQDRVLRVGPYDTVPRGGHRGLAGAIVTSANRPGVPRSGRRSRRDSGRPYLRRARRVRCRAAPCGVREATLAEGDFRTRWPGRSCA
jgi:hypothetical protein